MRAGKVSCITGVRTDSSLDAQGTTGNPYFDCVGMNSGAVPFKSFVQANGNNAKTLANHFVSYLKGGLSTKVPMSLLCML